LTKRFVRIQITNLGTRPNTKSRVILYRHWQSCCNAAATRDVVPSHIFCAALRFVALVCLIFYSLCVQDVDVVVHAQSPLIVISNKLNFGGFFFSYTSCCSCSVSLNCDLQHAFFHAQFELCRRTQQPSLTFRRWQQVWLVAIVPPERWGEMDRNDCHTALGNFKNLISSQHHYKNYACSFSFFIFYYCCSFYLCYLRRVDTMLYTGHGIYHGTSKVRPCQREIRRIFRSTMEYTMEYTMVYTIYHGIYHRVNAPLVSPSTSCKSQLF
jgi:hypothetical protein